MLFRPIDLDLSSLVTAKLERKQERAAGAGSQIMQGHIDALDQVAVVIG